MRALGLRKARRPPPAARLTPSSSTPPCRTEQGTRMTSTFAPYIQACGAGTGAERTCRRASGCAHGACAASPTHWPASPPPPPCSSRWPCHSTLPGTACWRWAGGALHGACSRAGQPCGVPRSPCCRRPALRRPSHRTGRPRVVRQGQPQGRFPQPRPDPIRQRRGGCARGSADVGEQWQRAPGGASPAPRTA